MTGPRPASDHPFAFVRDVLDSFLATRGGTLLSHTEHRRTGAYRYDFEVAGERFVLHSAHYSDGSAVFHVDERGMSYSLWESLHPFQGSLQNPDEVLKYLSSRPTFETTSEHIRWLLEHIPTFLDLPSGRRIESVIENLAE